MSIISSGITDIGQKRKTNQDAIYLNTQDHFYLVADGVGGHNAGEVASAMAVKLIPEYFLGQQISADNVKHYLSEAVKHANSAIFTRAAQDPELKGMGTTIIAMYFLGDTLYIANVGDSRSYLIHQEELFQITRDHSLIQEKLNLGIYTREQAAQDPAKNILVRTVGHEQTTQVDIFTYPLSPQDLFLLCSDGVHGIIANPDILTTIRQHLPPGQSYSQPQITQAIQALVDRANQNGGNDNISGILCATQ